MKITLTCYRVLINQLIVQKLNMPVAANLSDKLLTSMSDEGTQDEHSRLLIHDHTKPKAPYDGPTCAQLYLFAE